MSETFNGDSFIEREVLRLVQRHGIRTIVETGTYRGETTKALAQMAPQVFTIEIDPLYWQESSHLDALGNVRRIRGDSPVVFEELLPALERPVLFYLDAHWREHSPLLDELGVIAGSRQKPVIVIHDFLNPDHPEFGYDAWDIGVYRMELIASVLKSIYGPGGYVYHLNSEAQGLRRGIIYIEPQ
jgi:hypothetical protein